MTDGAEPGASAPIDGEPAGALQDQATTLELFARHASEIIVHVGAAGRILYVSPSVHRFGYRPEDLVGRPGTDIVHPDDLPSMLERRADLLKGKTLAKVFRTVRLRRADGSWVWVETHPQVIWDDDGRPTGYINLLRDVTDHAVLADTAREQQALFEAAFEHSAVGKVVLDTSGYIRRVNAAIRESLGYTPDQIVGLRDNDVAHPDEIDQFAAQYHDLIAGRVQSYQVERRYRHADGRWTPFSVTVSLARKADGSPHFILADLYDITARLAMEEALRRKTEAAEAASIAKSQFLSNMSHELRTPLTGVMGFADLLKGMALPGRGAHFVDRIATCADHLLMIVNDILDLAKLEAGQLRLQPRPLSPRTLLAEAVDLVRPQATAKGLDLLAVGLEALPDLAEADEGRLRQVLLNLLSNAVKFTAAGQVTLTAAWNDDEQILGVEVVDTGVGIAPEHQLRLFQRFSQVDESNTRQHGGAGLGLAICKSLVETMGGEVGVASELGRGSRFWFEVPLAVPEAAAAHAPSRNAGELAGLEVLVVDDVADNRELLTELLAPLGAEVCTAASGAEAVATASRRNFGLILMDLQMPGMDGAAATAAIRATAGANRGTPVVAVSGNAMPEQVRACLAAGLNDHLPKPFTRAQLLEKVRRHWRCDGDQLGQGAAR